MARGNFLDFDPSLVPSPCFVIDELTLEENLQILSRVQQHSGARILLALKAFAMFHLAPLISRYLSGTCASGLFEARLGREEFGSEVHTCCPAYREEDFAEILQLSDHVVFNSFSQWHRFKDIALTAQKQQPQLSFGLRINPQHSETTHAIYDPCISGSRLGIPLAHFAGQSLQGIDGLHFHTLCEQGFPPLQRTLQAVEEQFGHLLPSMQWVNFGGGHLITKEDYAIEALTRLINDFQQRYQVQVYLEPGEAVGLYAGVLIAEVLDLIHNDLNLAILDTSATCHMPDVLEMPYRPEILDAGLPQEYPHTYRLGGPTCLAGDIIGDYSFSQPLQIGKRLIFTEMAYYTMVKTNTFNGIPLPHIALWNPKFDKCHPVKKFSYHDFKERLS